MHGAGLEMRRGTLLLAIMLRLHNPHYGYSLRQALSESGIRIEEGTLYPLLRRFEEKGILTSEWRDRDGRSRRYYLLTDHGAQLRDNLILEWRALVAIVDDSICKQKEESPCVHEC